jgi:hypothetical protein
MKNPMGNMEQGVEFAHIDAVEPYAALINQKLLVPSNASSGFTLDREFALALMAPFIERIEFDENWYIETNPDVRDAISEGYVPSGHAHYIWHGFYEHRLPYHIDVDEDWYISVYPDVKEAIRLRYYDTAQAHFESAGFREGRLPYADFALHTQTGRSGPRPDQNRITI